MCLKSWQRVALIEMWAKSVS